MLYDAVAILARGGRGAAVAAKRRRRILSTTPSPTAKFIAYAETARPLFEKAGVIADDGVVPVKTAEDAEAFIAKCRELRLWRREPSVHAV